MNPMPVPCGIGFLLAGSGTGKLNRDRKKNEGRTRWWALPSSQRRSPPASGLRVSCSRWGLRDAYGAARSSEPAFGLNLIVRARRFASLASRETARISFALPRSRWCFLEK